MSLERRTRNGRGALQLAAFAILMLGAMMFATKAGGQAKSSSGVPEGTAAAEFVGSAACSRCHAEIYRRFSQTSMGRSMSPVTPKYLERTSGSYVNEGLQRRFEVYTKDGKLYQSESGIGADGKQSFEDAHPVDWIIGAGMNGFGAILQRDQYLFQAPLSFYTKAGNWAPSPGYEFADLGFDRPITAGCIFCHSGRSNPVAGGSGKFESAPFSELAIGCERCHGPGAAHVQAMHNMRTAAGTKPASARPLDTRIVNPASLTPYLADNICMACHQTGDVRVLKPGKTYQDVRPGRPLDETLAILMVPPKRDSPPSSDHVEHYYSMTLSKCYRASSGRLSCITCHDPHIEPTREEAPAYFNKKCLACHTNQSCKLPTEARSHTEPGNNCIGCHMPKRDIQVISHSSATNHRIVARPDEPFPEITFRQTTAQLPDLIHLNPAPGRESDPLPPLSLLEAYGELAEYKPEYVAPYLKVLGQLEQGQPEEPLVQSALGRRDLKNGDYRSAAEHLRQALKAPSPQATTYADLADALTHLGQTAAAIPLLEKAVDLDPVNPVTRKMLVVGLIDSKQYDRVREALKQYLAVFPQDDFMRQMLARAEGKSVQP